MKAKEYVEKYAERFNEASSIEQLEEVAANLFNELRDEMFDIVEKRHIKKIESFMSTKDEFNKKANKINERLGNRLKKDWYSSIMADLIAKLDPENVEE